MAPPKKDGKTARSRKPAEKASADAPTAQGQPTKETKDTMKGKDSKTGSKLPKFLAKKSVSDATEHTAPKKPAVPRSTASSRTDGAGEAAKAQQPHAPQPPSALPRTPAVFRASRLAASGRIEPSLKRPAQLPNVGNSSLYLREREQERFRLTASPMFAQGDFEGVEEAQQELPQEYGRTFLSALVRDPFWIYAFWEIASETREKLGLGRGDKQVVLRLHDVTGLSHFDGTNSKGATDVPVTDFATSWYLRVPEYGREFILDLLAAGADGNLVTVARSGRVQVPAMGFAPSNPQQVGESPEAEEIYRQILRLSGAEPSLRIGSSEEHLSSGAFLLGGASEAFSGSVTSWGGASEAHMPESVAGPSAWVGRKFWLEVGVEVIVYGATEPDAQVRFMGRDIQLRPDGSFGVRMALPDGAIEFPVEATSADNVETRFVCPIVSRRTVGEG